MTLIFKLVMSVLAILVIYDAISGEKEDQTLKLMLSNSVPRHHILLGKFIGGMITLAIPIAVGFLIASLILELSPAVGLTGDDRVRIWLMFAVSLILVSLMLNLGLLLSSLTRRASDTLMFLLFLWVIFLLVVPNASVYLAARIRPMKSREAADSQIGETWDRFQKELSEFYRENPEPMAPQSAGWEPRGWYYEFTERDLIRFKQKLNDFSEPLRIGYADDAWHANRNYLQSMKRQKKLAKLISKLSPISLYESLITSLARTDVSGSEGFVTQAREYRQEMIDYLYGIDAFSSIRYFATVNPEYLSDTSNDGYDRLREKYGRGASPLNVSAIPHFRYRPEGAAATVKRILADLVLLSFTSIALFICAFAAFLRCDVR